jgi:hypothetical protein
MNDKPTLSDAGDILHHAVRLANLVAMACEELTEEESDTLTAGINALLAKLEQVGEIISEHAAKEGRK